MMKLLDDIDARNNNCGFKLIDRDLFRGVGMTFKGDSTIQDDKSFSSIVSSRLIDSERIANDVKMHADPSELKPVVLIEAEPTPPSSVSKVSSILSSSQSVD